MSGMTDWFEFYISVWLVGKHVVVDISDFHRRSWLTTLYPALRAPKWSHWTFICHIHLIHIRWALSQEPSIVHSFRISSIISFNISHKPCDPFHWPFLFHFISLHSRPYTIQTQNAFIILASTTFFYDLFLWNCSTRRARRSEKHCWAGSSARWEVNRVEVRWTQEEKKLQARKKMRS